MSTASVFPCAACLFVVLAGAALASPDRVLLTVPSPDPKGLPTLGVWQSAEQTLVSATFPGVPEFTCDCWCYESALTFVDVKAEPRGSIVQRHRVDDDPVALLRRVRRDFPRVTDP